MILRLSYPPTVNTYWRSVGRKVLISAKGRAYRSIVKFELLDQRARGIEGPVSVTITAHAPDKRRRDIDNLPKALLDSLQHGGLFQDDNQVEMLTIIRGALDPCGIGYVEVEMNVEPKE